VSGNITATLSASDNIRVYADAAGTQPLVEPGRTSDPWDVAKALITPLPTTVYVAGVEAGSASLTWRVSVDGYSMPDTVNFTVVDVDLDVDSNNDDVIDPINAPGGTDDPREEELPGKRLGLGGELVPLNVSAYIGSGLDHADVASLQLSGVNDAIVRVWDSAAKTTRLTPVNGVISWPISSDCVSQVWIEAVGLGSLQLALSLKVGGRSVATDIVSVTAVPSIRILALTFDDIGVKDDPSSQSPKPNAPAPRYGLDYHWEDTNLDGNIDPAQNDIKVPAAYVRDSVPHVTARFKMNGPDQSPRVGPVEIRGTGPGGIAFPAKMLSPDGDGTYSYKSASSAHLPNKVMHYDDFEITWEVREPGGKWIGAGATANDLYVTLAQPVGGAMYHTVLHIGSHFAQGSETEDDVILAVWKHFRGLAVQKQDETTHIGALAIPDGGAPLKYWANYERPGGSETSALLAYNGGECGGFADFFLHVLMAQGISQQDPFVQVSSSILVQRWEPQGQQIVTPNGQVDVVLFAPFEETDDRDAPFTAMFTEARDRYNLNEFSQLRRLPGLAGQNSPAPRADFGLESGHIFVRLVIGGVTRWLDPSYGVEYAGDTDDERINSFEDQAVYGLIQDGEGEAVSDVEIALGVDCDGDGNITSDEAMTKVVKQIVVKRQKPGVQDVQYHYRGL
jgi:hypothetical protein